MKPIGAERMAVAAGQGLRTAFSPRAERAHLAAPRIRALGAGFLALFCGTRVLALFDQAVVSGTSFLTMVLVGRSAISSELGIYSIGITLSGSMLAIQDSLILLPYTIQMFRPGRTPAEHAGASLMHSAVLSVLAMALAAATAVGLLVRGAPSGLVAMVWVLVGAAPFALLREHGRTMAFARLRVARALILDSIVAAAQLAALGWLTRSGQMTAASASAAVGGGCALGGLGWLYLARADFAIKAERVRAATRESWGLGKWLFVSQLTVSIQGYVTYWMLPSLLGLSETGVFAACMSIASIANPFVSAFRKVLTPRAVLAFRDGGGARLRRQAAADTVWLGAGLALFCAVIFFFGADAMRLLFHGREYEAQSHVITVLAVAILAAAVGSTASNALASMESPRAIVWATSVGAVVTAILVWFCAAEWGLLGAAFGVLAGNVAGTAARWAAFLTVVAWRSEREAYAGGDEKRTQVVRVLRQLTGRTDDDAWAVDRLGEGACAKVFAVSSRAGRPVWRTYSCVIVKLYKRHGGATLELTKGQFEAHSRLYSALDGETIAGWKIHVPKPLYVSELPPALVMSMVPGRKLTSCLDAGHDVEMLGVLAGAIVASMERCWSVGQVHGDLNLGNLLCDTDSGDLSFVDVGVPTDLFLGEDLTKGWHPASHDLGYLLYETGVTVKSVFNNRSGLQRRQRFVQNLLQSFLATIESIEERHRLLGEIRACARFHLARLVLSRSPRGLWRFLVKTIAARRIDAMILRLESSLPALGGRLHDFADGRFQMDRTGTRE